MTRVLFPCCCLLLLVACGKPSSSTPTVSSASFTPPEIPSPAVAWASTWKDAFLQAHHDERPVLAFFTIRGRKDPEGMCGKLEQELLSTSEFKAWAAERVHLLRIDFSEKDDEGSRLFAQRRAYQYQVVALPTVLFLDAYGNDLGRLGYQPDGIKPWLARAEHFLHQAKIHPAKPLPLRKDVPTAISIAREDRLPLLVFTRTKPRNHDLVDNFLHLNEATRLIEGLCVPVLIDPTLETGLPGLPRGHLPDQAFVLSSSGDQILAQAQLDRDLEIILQVLQPRLAVPNYQGGWLDDVEKGFRLARILDRHLLLVAINRKEPHCQKFERNVLKSPEFLDLARRKLVLVGFDLSVTEDPSLRPFNITKVPTVVLVDPRGCELARGGYDEQPLKDYLASIEDRLKPSTTLPNPSRP